MDQLTLTELSLAIEAINHSIAYRLNHRTRMSELADLKSAKLKLIQQLDQLKSSKTL